MRLGNRPRLREGADQDIEAPGGAGLVGDVPAFGSDVLGLAEEVIGLVGVALAGPGHVDDGVNGDEGHMDALRP